MSNILSLILLFFFLICQNDFYNYYKEVIEKPVLMIDKSDFISDKVHENSIKSIKAYKYHEGEIFFASEDSTIEDNKALFYFASYRYNRKGLMIQLNQMFDKYSNPKIFTFSYNKDNKLAYQTFSYNGYDTIYYIYYFNENGDYYQEIQFNNRRSEINRFILNEIKYDSENINSTVFDYAHDTLLIFKWNNTISFNNNEIIKTRYRIMLEDTGFNHFPDTTIYRLYNKKLYISSQKSGGKEKVYHYSFYPDGTLKSQIYGTDSIWFNLHGDKELQVSKFGRKEYNYVYDSFGNWIVRRCIEENNITEIIKRYIEYYDDKSTDEKPDFEVSQSIFHKADSLCKVIPDYAKEKSNIINKRKYDIQNGNFDSQITRMSGNSPEDFIPEYWTLVTYDSGHLFPYDSTVFIAGYNTPVPTQEESEEYLRCLAIFEQRNNVLYMKEQLFEAIDSYTEGSTEADAYEITIENNCISVFYEYMRGEASYTYEFDSNEQDWRLIYQGSSHRTCCEASSMAYDYKNGLIHLSKFQMSDDEEGENDIDTTIFNEVLKEKFIYLREKDSWVDNPEPIYIENYGNIYF